MFYEAKKFLTIKFLNLDLRCDSFLRDKPIFFINYSVHCVVVQDRWRHTPTLFSLSRVGVHLHMLLRSLRYSSFSTITSSIIFFSKCDPKQISGVVEIGSLQHMPSGSIRNSMNQNLWGSTLSEHFAFSILHLLQGICRWLISYGMSANIGVQLVFFPLII